MANRRTSNTTHRPSSTISADDIPPHPFSGRLLLLDGPHLLSCGQYTPCACVVHPLSISSSAKRRTARWRISHMGWRMHDSKVGCDASAIRATQPGVAGADDGLGAAGDLKLAEDVGDVVANGLSAEDELLGDGGVGETLGDEAEDLALAVGQLREGLGRRGRRRGAKVLHQAAGDGWAEDGFAVGDSANGTNGLVAAGAIEQVAAGAGAHGGEDGVV